jgi:hypothetical protein
MLPQYYDVVAGTPKIVLMNNNNHVFNVSVRVSVGLTVEAALEDLYDARTAPLAPKSGPKWVLLQPSVLNASFYFIENPVRLLRLTGTGDATILQQGIQ